MKIYMVSLLHRATINKHDKLYSLAQVVLNRRAFLFDAAYRRLLHCVIALRITCVSIKLRLVLMAFPKAPFTRYNLLSNRLSNRFDKPVECLYTRYNRLSVRLSDRLYNRSDKRLYRVNGIKLFQLHVKGHVNVRKTFPAGHTQRNSPYD